MTNHTSTNNICIGIFIHNEELHIERCLQDLSNQSIFNVKDIGVQVYLLCNGCTDNSIQVLSKLANENNYIVFDWSEGGKSRTWNRFVHDMITDDAETIVFLDGDLRLPEPQTIERLVSTLNSSPSVVATSKPVKDISRYSWWNPLRFIASVIKSPHRDGSICGQLYAMKRNSAQNVWLPNPCLVEDGFLAATIVTDFFQGPSEMARVKAVPKAWHIFEPPNNLGEFFQHDVRLTLGVELNAALYTQLWDTKSFTEAQQLLQEFSAGNRIDVAIDEHLGMPQNRALQFKRVLRYAWPKGQHLIKGLILLPVRIAHMIYMFFVFRTARTQFLHSQFKW